MGTSKKHFYPSDQLIFSNLCKALGHPARISIIDLLSKGDSLNCRDLGVKIPLSQSSISRHCHVLHQSGIVGYEVIGSNCYYRLDNGVLDQITEFIGAINTETPSLSGNVYYPQSRL